MRWLIYVLFWLISMALTYMIFAITIPFSRHVSILNISHNEIMELEKKRLLGSDGKPRLDVDGNPLKFFFGKTEEAERLIISLRKELESRTEKVVFSIEPVYGADVVSVSKKIHAKLIARLATEANQ